METRDVHLTIAGERTHAHVVIGHDRSIDTDLDPGSRCGLSITVEVHEGSPFTIWSRASDRDHLSSAPRTERSPRRENPRVCTPLGRSPTTLPTTCTGTNGRPCLWVIRCYVITRPRGGSAPTTNSLNRACLGETDPGRRSLSRARSSAGNRRHRGPSQGHRK